MNFPNFNVDLGFGLHIGEAIEGAIGSIYKIEASYLSLTVNKCMALENLNKLYGTNILVSQ